MSEWLNRLGLHENHPLHGVCCALFALALFYTLYHIGYARLAKYARERAQRPENAEGFLRTVRAVCKSIIAVLVLVAATGSLAWMGLTIGFLATILGWSLQAPIRGLAAWLMVVVKRPFGIGDRISVAGVTGDVTDIQLNHIVIAQVGGTVAGEDRSGRGILIPNAMLWGENISNYNLFGKEAQEVPATILDEITVRITFGSDQERAAAMCLDCAKNALVEILGEIDEPPFLRREFLPSGVLYRVRYQVPPARRQEVSTAVTEHLMIALRTDTAVHFLYPRNITGLVPPDRRRKFPMAPR